MYYVAVEKVIVEDSDVVVNSDVVAMESESDAVDQAVSIKLVPSLYKCELIE